MGYYTKYSLTVINDNYSCDHKKEIEELSGYDNIENYEIKWHLHEDHMRQYSKRHPDVLFCLHGEGETDGDIWNKYFKNGKMQECRGVITYPEFNEIKLS